MLVTIHRLECLRCGHKWVPTKEDIRMCPKCKSAYWDKLKKKVSNADSKASPK